MNPIRMSNVKVSKNRNDGPTVRVKYEAQKIEDQIQAHPDVELKRKNGEINKKIPRRLLFKLILNDYNMIHHITTVLISTGLAVVASGPIFHNPNEHINSTSA